MIILTLLITVLIIVILDIKSNMKRLNKDKSDFTNPIPETFDLLDEKKLKLIELYLKEWETVVQTQMHFNDLILRFRTVTLTAFATLGGALIAIQRITKLTDREVVALVIVLCALWITSFIIDFFYYQRLLLGSVKQAYKYDRSELSKFGFFGMTQNISDNVHPPTTKFLIGMYYLFPFLIAIGLLIWRFGFEIFSYEFWQNL